MKKAEKTKRSEKVRNAAREAHLRGKKAFDKGDIKAAFRNDDKAVKLAWRAAILDLKGE